MKTNRVIVTVLGLILLCILQVFDVLLTYFGLHIYGVEAEGNPIVKYVIYHTNILVGLLLIKIPAIALIYYIIKYIKKLYTTKLFYFVILLNILYIFSCIMWFLLLFL